MVTTADLASTDIKGKKKAVSLDCLQELCLPTAVQNGFSNETQLWFTIQSSGAKSRRGLIPTFTLAAVQAACWWQRTHQAPLPGTSPVVRLHSLHQNSDGEAAQRGCGSIIHGGTQTKSWQAWLHLVPFVLEAGLDASRSPFQPACLRSS